MLTLHDIPISGNAYKVRLVLASLGLPYRRRVVDLFRGETRTPAFLAKNLAGEAPVLELPDGTCLAESSAILWYLAEETALLPADRLERARVLRWMAFEQTHVDGVISRARFRRSFPDAVPTRAEEFAAWWSEGTWALGVLDAHLAGRDWFVGPSVTIADLCLYAYVHCAPEGGFELDPFPAVRAWLARVERRPDHVPLDQPWEPSAGGDVTG